MSTKINWRQIKDVEELKKLATDAEGYDVDYAIMLVHGAYSRKGVQYEPEENLFWVYNHIDDSEQLLTEEQLFDTDYTNVGDAIKKGHFFVDSDQINWEIG